MTRALHRAVPRPAAPAPRRLRVDVHRQHRDADWCSRPSGRAIVVHHARDRPLRRRHHRRVERLAATHMHAGLAEHGRLVAGRSSLLGAAVGAINGVLVAYGRLQPILVTLATLVDPPGPRDLDPARAGRRRSRRLTRTPSRTRTARGACSSWLVVVAALVRPPPHDDSACGSSRSATTSTPPARTGCRCAASRSTAYALSGLLAAASGLFLAATHDRRRRRRRRRLRPHLDRRRRARRHQLLRRTRQRPRQHRGRVRAHGPDQRPLLRRHRPALPVVLPGPVPRSLRSCSAHSLGRAPEGTRMSAAHGARERWRQRPQTS